MQNTLRNKTRASLSLSHPHNMTMMTCLNELRPVMAMIIVQFAYGGVNVLYKIAANDGMKMRVIVAYRLIFATAFILPLAFFLERKRRPKLTWIILFQGFLCGLFGGSLSQYLYLGSLTLTDSASFAAAMTNLIPAITYILALSVGMEKPNLGDIRGKAKLLGSVMGIGGAAILTMYKGVDINVWSTHFDLLRHHHNLAPSPQEDHSKNHALGCVLGVACCISLSLWLIVQAKMSKRYPCHYSSTALMSTMASIQIMILAVFTEKDWTQWKLSWDIRLLTVAYSGTVASGLVVVVIAWCVHMRGPVFASAFSPLMLVLVAIAGSLFLHEDLHLGSVLAAVLIVAGLYLILWGKAKEIMMNTGEKTIVISTQLLSEKQPADRSVHVHVADSDDDKTVMDTHQEGLTGLQKLDVEKGF